jgi:hypothetical protein
MSEHHASCRPSDKNLVWHCSQCGLNEPVDAEALARSFHEIYERLAPKFGYETRKDTRAFDPTTPNGRLMIAVCEEL